jgi:hypothetical protein
MKMEKTAIGRSRSSGKERDKVCDDQTERGGRRREESGCRLHLVCMGEGVSTEVPICRIHLDETK